MRDPDALRSERDGAQRPGGRGHYDPNQPRVPAGDPKGGQFASKGYRGGDSGRDVGATRASFDGAQFAELGQGGSGGAESLWLARSDLPSHSFTQNDPSAQRDNIPVYDTYDAALLHPKGVSSTGGRQTLQYELDDGHYLGGVTVTNADRTVVGRLIQSMNRAPITVRFDAEIHTTDGVSRHSFEIKENLSPGSSKTIPWKELGPLRGPGRVVITATNIGSQSTGVIVGATRMTTSPKGR